MIDVMTSACGDAGDHYTGLDRFGRVVDQRWLNSDGTAVDRFQYGYDANSNRLYKENLLDATKSELYGPYDNLNRLTTFDRGTLDGEKDGISGSPSRSQDWTLDALGNWQTLSDGGSQNRTHNAQNQVTAIQGQSTPTYDNNGNTTTDQSGKHFVYDAWNRLVAVNNSSNTLVESFSHDAASRKITETPSGGPTRVLYYSSQWQVVEERQGGVAVAQQVWSPVYVDAMIERDRDSDGNQTLDERLYVMQDANYNVTALTNTSGAVVERYLYDPYGMASVLDANWSADADGQSDVAWRYLHQGGRYDAASGLYEFRHRAYSPNFGRWMQQDPMGYVDGTSLYQYCRNNPTDVTDPLGTYPVGFPGARPTDNDPGPEKHRALYIDVVPEINPKGGDAKQRAKDQAKGQEGKRSDSAIWLSALYAHTLSRSDVTLRTTSVEDMINKVQRTVKHPPDPTLKCGDAISRLVIRAHGWGGGGVTVGNWSQEGTGALGQNIVPESPSYDGLLVAQLRGLRGYFTKDAEIVLWSCYTGKNTRFLQELANITGVKVSALTSDTAEPIFMPWKEHWITVWPNSPTTVPARPHSPTTAPAR